MKISVITVTRNSAATLPDALRSVASQSLKELEHIVIDGASTDTTAEAVRLHGAHVSKFLSEPDIGIYDAMNKGLRLATGDIIGFLNADDYYADSGVLERVVETMSRLGLDLIYGDVAFFRKKNPHIIVRRYRSDRFSPRRLAWGWMPAHPAFFMKKEMYQRIGLFNTNYRIAGDFEMMTRIFQQPQLRFEHLPEILVLMRAGGVSNSGLTNTITLNMEVLEACKENNINTNIFMLASKYFLKLFEYISYKRLK